MSQLFSPASGGQANKPGGPPGGMANKPGGPPGGQAGKPGSPPGGQQLQQQSNAFQQGNAYAQPGSVGAAMGNAMSGLGRSLGSGAAQASPASGGNYVGWNPLASYQGAVGPQAPTTGTMQPGQQAFQSGMQSKNMIGQGQPAAAAKPGGYPGANRNRY